MTDIDKIDCMIKILREMKSDAKKMQKLSSFDLAEMTPKQAQNRNADADWIGMEQIKRKHELHALAVELGFSDRRSSYDEIGLRDNWHRFKFKPREPNG